MGKKLISSEPLDNMPSGKNLFEQIGDNFPNVGYAILEFVDDSASNIQLHQGDRDIVKKITVKLEKKDGGVWITVIDGGSGIENLHNALCLAGQEEKNSPLNEHGLGMKHALASCCVGIKQIWILQTRTRADAALNQYREVSGPYTTGSNATDDKQGTIFCYEGSGDIPYYTGTMISVLCSDSKFASLKRNNVSVTPTFKELVALLEELLRYTYAEALKTHVFQIEVIADDDSSKFHTKDLLEPLEPAWQPDTYKELPEIRTDLGGGDVGVQIRYGMTYRRRNCKTVYRCNMRTSGAEVRLNGRAITHGLWEKIWGDAAHNTQNRFLAQVNVLSDNPDTLPSTMNTKSAFCDGDPRFNKLLGLISTCIKEPLEDTDGIEHILVCNLIAKLQSAPNLIRCDMEEPSFTSVGLHLAMDLYVVTKDKAVIYEAKAGRSKSQDLSQLRTYIDGCAIDGKACDEAVLIAESHSPDVVRLAEVLNTFTDPNGKRYNIRLDTWDEEGIEKPIREVD